MNKFLASSSIKQYQPTADVLQTPELDDFKAMTEHVTSLEHSLKAVLEAAKCSVTYGEGL